MTNEKEFSLVALEDEYVVSSHGLSRHRPGLHPTEASVVSIIDGRELIVGQCMRSSWYRSMEKKKTNPASPGLMQKANLGKWDENGLIERWKEMGIWIGNSIKFYQKNYYLSGEMDAIIREPETGRKIGYEVKTFYGYYANKVITGAKESKKMKTPMVPGVPKDNQFLQSIVYAWEYRDQLDEYRMYYMERGDGHRVEFRIGFDELPSGEHQVWWQQVPGKYWNGFAPEKVLQPYNIEGIYARYDQLLAKLKAKEMPPREFSTKWDAEKVEWMWEHGLVGKTKYNAWKKKPETNPIGDWNCDYCSYRSLCDLDASENSD